MLGLERPTLPGPRARGDGSGAETRPRDRPDPWQFALQTGSREISRGRHLPDRLKGTQGM